jgi:hypothetical protein
MPTGSERHRAKQQHVLLTGKRHAQTSSAAVSVAEMPTPCAHTHLLEHSSTDVAKVACHHCAPHPVVNIAVPKVQAVDVWDAVRPKHEATAAAGMHDKPQAVTSEAIYEPAWLVGWGMSCLLQQHATSSKVLGCWCCWLQLSDACPLGEHPTRKATCVIIVD